jgi:glycosyltransferase involved in cell wall biosynthesis
MHVSVVVPTRNRSRLLATTLRGVLRQRAVDLEVIVVDEASTDDTAAVIRALADPRIRLVRHDTPRGVSAARNHGAEEARGAWVAFLDDDDLWAPDKLTRQLQAAVGTGRDWAYTGSVNIVGPSQVVYGEPPPPPEHVVAAIRRYNAIPGGGSNVVVRRTTLQRAGLFDTRLRNTEDWEMWIRLAKMGPPAWVCSPLMAYRVHASNSSLNVAEVIRGARLIEQLHATTVDWGRIHRWFAESYLRVGCRQQALRQFARAAVRGQARGVVSDVTAILRRRVRRWISDYPGQASASAAAWIEEASVWLRELDDCAPAENGETKRCR